MDIILKKATINDCDLIFNFIKNISVYEKMENEVKNNPAMIRKWLFEKKCAETLIAYADGVPAGYALYYYNYATFVGKPGLYLEDIFVNKEYRGKGIGKKLFQKVASIASEEGCERMEWVCLDWNKPSIDFYKSMGAKPMSEWTTYRLSGDDIKKASV